MEEGGAEQAAEKAEEEQHAAAPQSDLLFTETESPPNVIPQSTFDQAPAMPDSGHSGTTAADNVLTHDGASSSALHAQQDVDQDTSIHQQGPEQQQDESQHATAEPDPPVQITAAAEQHASSSTTDSCQVQSSSSTDAAAVGDNIGDSLQHVLSLAASKRANMHLLDSETLVMAAGCSVLLLHMPTMQQRFLPGRDGGGVAAVAVHPGRKRFAVAEKCRSRPPNIYIYSYPDLALEQTLAAGTDRAYSATCFSPDGTRLAAVGSSPDYLLTLWDWAAGATLLRCKAFSQEVYGLGFCPHSPGHLVSCGTGHIRFWKMASTFTGLKLQGALGRFGAVELSDVAVFVELPDGKVLSGSEAGDLLLWEGGLIKAVISRPGGARCHEGAIEVLLHDAQTNYLISGGGDGTLRLWDVAKVQDAEPPEGSNTVALKPAVTVAVQQAGGSSSSSNIGGVRALVWMDSRTWLVQSEAGAVFKVNVPLNILDQGGYTVSQLMQLQAGGVVGCSTCPDRHVLLTACGDGTIRALDYRSQAFLQQRRFSSHISSMVQLPAAADPQQRMVLLGFADGRVRLVARCSDGWAVLAAARPHKVAVTCMAISSDGCRLAAVAADGGVFILLLDSHKAQLEPLVACQLQDAAGPTCCCWDAGEGRRLLVGCSSGVAVEVTVPRPGAVDTHKTYQQQLPMRRFTARLPLRQQSNPEQEQQRQQEQQQSNPTAAADGSSTAGEAGPAGAGSAPDGMMQLQLSQTASTQQQQLQLASESQGEQQIGPAVHTGVAEDGDEDQQQQPVLPITWVSYHPGSSDMFLLWLGGQGAGQVLTCSWASQPPSCIGSSSTTAVTGAAVSCVSRSWSGCFQLLGTADGQVSLEEVGPAPRSWQCPMHDMHEGRITGLAMAYDDSCLISAAADGTLLLLRNALGAPPTAAAAAPLEANAGLPTMAAAIAAAAAAGAGSSDDSAGAEQLPLSLEEAKQAAQRDQQVATAAAARQQLVAAVEVLRHELAALMQEDAARPPAERLAPEAFHVDDGLPALVAAERAQRLAAARAQVAYDAEVAQVKLSKLQRYFAATLAEHVVTVHAFGDGASNSEDAADGKCSRRSVSTFRPPELPHEVMVALNDAEAEEAQQQHQQQQQQDQQQGQTPRNLGKFGRSPQQSFKSPHRSSKGSFKARISQEALVHDANKGNSNDSNQSAASRAELWRQAKRQRAAEWAAFNASRPDDTYDAPEDIAALQHAAATIGDFKLKSDPGFMLPEDQRWTPAKKRRQMLLLMRQLSEQRASHNAQVLALRQRKRDLVAQLNDMQGRLAQINRKLGVTEPTQQPVVMRPDEEPEHHLMHVSEEQLAVHQAAIKAASDKAAGLGALGGFAAAAAAASPATSHGGTAQGKAKQGALQQSVGAAGSTADAAGGAHDSGWGQHFNRVDVYRLQAEQQRLKGTLSSLQSGFDASVAALRSTQLQLAVDLKATEGRLFMMLRELMLLKDAEAKELALEAKRANKLAEADDMTDHLAELQAQLDDKRAEGEAAAARRAALVGELEVLVAEHDSYREALTKIFYRRIKRAKKHGPGSTMSGADSSDCDSDGGSDMGDEDGSDSDSSGSEEVCPPGCDPALYEAVVELREHRLDEEEAAAEVSKAVEALGKDKTLLSKKAKLVDTALAAINQEVLEFHVDKQARLNQLPATVSLRRHQLAMLDDAGSAALADGAYIPCDLSEALVFSSHELDRLQQRMQELDHERDGLKHHQKELKLQHKQLQEDKATKEAKLAGLSAHCTDVQLLKFGQVIDVSMLDSIGVRNKTADELRQVLKNQAVAATEELSDWDTRVAGKRRELLGILRENTAALTTVTDLTRSQRDLEARVLAGRSELWQDPLSSRRAAMSERDKFVTKISDQAGQLDALRMQLAAMRRKDSNMHG